MIIWFAPPPFFYGPPKFFQTGSKVQTALYLWNIFKNTVKYTCFFAPKAWKKIAGFLVQKRQLFVRKSTTRKHRFEKWRNFISVHLPHKIESSFLQSFYEENYSELQPANADLTNEEILISAFSSQNTILYFVRKMHWFKFSSFAKSAFAGCNSE